MKSPIPIIVMVLCVLLSCQKAQGTVPRTSYEAAASYVKSHYKGETMQEKSSMIYKVVFYPAEGQNFMLVYFMTKKNKGYIYEAVPTSVWKGWRKASSKGRYYNASVKGKFRFKLSN